MKRDNDLRVIRTRKAIENAFLELIEKKPFDKVTINDIAEAAMINRSTFYLHYLDKFDLLDHIIDAAFNEIAEAVSGIPSEEIELAFRRGEPLPHVIKMLEYIEKHVSFMKYINDNRDGIGLYDRAADVLMKRHKNIDKVFAGDEWNAGYRQRVCLSVISSIVKKWVDDGMTVSKQDIAQLMTELVKKIIL